MIAIRYHHLVAEYLMHWIQSGIIAAAIAFMFCLVLVMMAAGILGSALRAAARQAHLGTHDRMLGSVFGLAKGAVLVTVMLLAASIFLSTDHPTLAQSKLFPYFIRLGEQVIRVIPQEWKDSITTRQGELVNPDQRPSPVVPERSKEHLEEL